LCQQGENLALCGVVSCLELVFNYGIQVNGFDDCQRPLQRQLFSVGQGVGVDSSQPPFDFLNPRDDLVAYRLKAKVLELAGDVLQVA
jgi:hypothetical protein